MAATAKKNAAAKSRRIKTNLAVDAVGMSDEERKDALNELAFGDNWAKFEADIAQRLADFPDDAPIVQSTQRALEMVKNMMFDKLAK